MKKNISILAIAGVAAVAVQLPSQANPKKPYVGAGYSLNGLSGLTVMGRVPVAESISIRPEVAFTSFGTLFGASGTYDFTIPESKLTPYAGIGFTGVCGLMGYIDLQKPDLGRGTGFQVSPMLLRTAV